jgi:imidazolonepropionase-like amidohydrolase
MMHRASLFLLTTALLAFTALGQVNAPLNGPQDKGGVPVAFVHATVHPAPGELLNDATVVILDDRIVSVGERVAVPSGAVIVDLKGLHVWPGLIEPYSDLGMTKGEKTDRKGARFWNSAIRPSTRADESYQANNEKAEALRSQGFTTVVTHMMDGIARGTSAVVQLAGRNAVQDILVPRAAGQFSFRKGTSTSDYPSSLMGSIALLRQTLYDARWYAERGQREQSDAELQALNEQLALPLVFEAGNRQDVLRATALAREFGLSFIVKGHGDEYMRLADILSGGTRLIVPLQLPEALEVEDPFEALEATLPQLKHWELAPTNPARIHEAGGEFAFTTHGLKETGDMWASLRRMVRQGLDSATAMAALTTVPAAMYRMEDRVGSLKAGMIADLVITSHHLLDERNVIKETWVSGLRFASNELHPIDLRATYDLNLRSTILRMRISGEREKPEAEVSRSGDSTQVKAGLRIEQGMVTLWFPGEKLGFAGPVRLNGSIHPPGSIWDGQGQLPGGEWIAWSAVRQGMPNSKVPREKLASLDSLWNLPTGQVWYPFNAYGTPTLPDTENVVFRNAAVWTNGPQGILTAADVCISGGRIVGVGPKLNVDALFAGKRRPSITEVDATGKHITCGIIDEHSHIAIERGVNEGSQAITAEVRIADVVDPDDVDLYRNLAGGVVAVQQLHGSANPIGGQSSLIKLRWGADANDMRIAGAPGFIKFALGENVKQSNWGEHGSRFPQTRMGVEQLMYDAFHRAREYDREFSTYMQGQMPKGRRTARSTPTAPSPRRDLELETLAEILRKERFISCHSYVQSEVLMLMRVADSMGFHVNTFTHILEGYKVAKQLKAHGATASTFSDWWAYKYEVNDAIPQNAALLTRMGVNTCINSDDAEMSRRLNQEAAKTMKYGGLSREEAWRMVTLNAAKALHLDDRMGSVEVGKDADIVVWSADPLSIEAKVESTFVDGVRRFDRTVDAELRKAMAAERERIITRMIAAKKAGAPAKKAGRKEHRHWTCETLGEAP